jgi:[ribosomal protein S5]-alanine N-acetyltransferase
MTLGANSESMLETSRLLLRPLELDDAPVMSKLAGRREIADTTISIPHPYSDKQAREWIASHIGKDHTDKEIIFAITLKADEQLVGTVGLRDVDHEHSQAEMGFWVALEAWGKGYATEAASAILGFGFEKLQLNRIYAHHMVRNPASGRVLEKIGMKKEGLLRERVRKWEVFEDVVVLAMLRSDWVIARTQVSRPSTHPDI